VTEPSRPRPFDGAARGYDDDFTRTAVGRLQRRRVWQVLERVLPDAGDVLDLGCGTGEDLVWLARRGAGRVVGCDASPAMLEAARAKVETAGVADRVGLVEMDLRRIQSAPEPGDRPFAGALADFGVLNCLEDRRPVAATASRWLAPGAVFVVVLMGRWCLWEIAWHLLKLRPGAAFRRWRQGRAVPVDGGGSLRVWYPTPGQLEREFRPAFELVETIGVGAFVPPPYLEPVVATRPRLLGLLDRLETRFGHRRPWAVTADHVLFVFRNTGQPSPLKGPGS